MRLLILVFLLTFGCGYDDGDDGYEPTPRPPAPPPPPGEIPDPPSWVEMQALFSKNCVRCHGNDAFGKSAEALRASGAETRLRNGSMPPNPDDISIDDRARMIAFF